MSCTVCGARVAVAGPCRTCRARVDELAELLYQHEAYSPDALARAIAGRFVLIPRGDADIAALVAQAQRSVTR